MILLLPLFSLLHQAASSEPRAVEWSDTSIGPDGPWNVVKVNLGFDASVSMFAGATWASWILTTDYCTDAFQGSCPSGGYDLESEDPYEDIAFPQSSAGLLRGVKVTGDNLTMVREEVNFGYASVYNHSVSLVEDQYISYPGGNSHPLFAGCLSVGATSNVQTFEDIEAPMIPWSLYEDEEIPSSSFGLHIGSTVPGAAMSGSLVFGGYDRNRIVGSILKLQGDFRDTIRLLDISIKVVTGSSPFDFDSKNDLLTERTSDNSREGLDILLDPCSPYLTLPKSTCDNIADHLPITYDTSLGLYLWDVDDSRYDTIVRSASTLSFEFMGSSNTETITIDIPFRHLNLTLEPPLTSSPVPYFPCSAAEDENAVLGRAFFQDAFLGGNWEERVWWLGQAPGPNIQSSAQVVSIDYDSDTIESSSNDWEESWTGIWEVSEEPAPTITSHPDDDDEMSQGTKIGIGVGVGAGALLLIGGLVLWLWRRKARKSPVETVAPITTAPLDKPENRFYYLDHTTPAELHSHSESGYAGHRSRDGGIAHELQ